MAVYPESNGGAGGGRIRRPSHTGVAYGIKLMLARSTSTESLTFYEPGKWSDSKEGMGFFFSILTAVYALTLTVFSLALEMSPTDQGDVFKMIFELFMFCGGIITLAYFYLFILHPEWARFVERALSFVGVHKKFHFDKVQHGGAGAGSLFLRLGAVAFGIVGIVYCVLKLVLCIQAGCKTSYIVTNIIQPIFIFIQMHFIFCNSKMTVSKNCKIAKFGIMHLVAVNLWTWFRNFLEKQKKKVKNSYTGDYISASSEEEGLESTTLSFLTTMTTTTAKPSGIDLIQSIFGSTKIIMSTCLVEYSLIGAGVMFVLWVSIGSHHSDVDHPAPTRTLVRRKHRMRVDCSASSTGLFFGLLFLIVAFVGIGVFDAESKIEAGFAGWFLSEIDGILFLWALIGCVIGIWRLRLLSYVTHSHGGAHSIAETLDEILLIIGLVGEIIFCSVMLLQMISASDVAGKTFGLSSNNNGILLASTIIRIVQVLLQSVLILMSLKIAAIGETNAKRKPGKEFITFLLVANIALFIILSYRAQRESDDGVGVFSAEPWTSVLQAVSPLLMFYRFHSSVCLAEVWKHAYTAKEPSHAPQKMSNGNISTHSLHVNNEEHRL